MPNVAAAAWEHARTQPDRLVLRGPAGEWTYAELRERSAAFAGALLGAGIGPGDRVVLCAPSVPEFVAAYLGVHAVGAILITVNTMATRPEIEYVIEDAGASLAIVWHEIGPATAEAATGRGIPLWALKPGAPVDAGTPLDALHEAALEDTSTILYTSGTTGRPKGAQLSTGNILACAEIFVDSLELTAEDRFGTGLPLFHVFGQAVVMGTTLRAGGSLSLLPRFEPGAMIEMVRRDRLTGMAGVPTMWNAMLHAAGEVDPADFAGLRLAASGGASLPADVIRAFSERFGCVILEGYGLTETTGSATFNGLHRERKPGSVGIALEGCEVQTRRPDGAECDRGEVGEVFIRGPVVMKGYWGREEATAEALRDGWLKTGDLATIDEDGDIRIVDRLKDMIIRGGYNVYPSEVEEVLYGHPDVVEAAVIGVPDDHFGEEIGAAVALKPGAEMSVADLRAWMKEQLSAYKVPRLIQFVEALPKGPTGKVLKREIEPEGLRAASA
jgi:long-chain acyl-CoA synthetase